MTYARIGFSIAALAIVAAVTGGPRLQSQTPDTVAAILERFVADFRGDSAIHDALTFSVQIGDEHWHVIAGPAASGQPREVALRTGEPATPTFYFRMDRDTLQRIDRGELNALTAAVQAFSTDPAPLRVGLMDGAPRSPEALNVMQRALFHFWTRGNPEVIPFGDAFTRSTHGTDAVVLYYQRGFRSGWFSLKPGQHANKDPRSQVNPFPTLLIVTSGHVKGRIGGREIDGRAGQAVLIPASTTHEFWNTSDKPVEGLLIMFGGGA
jgi:mannose-6-phosphate isomerase-like protein (cupin superfamily)